MVFVSPLVIDTLGGLWTHTVFSKDAADKLKWGKKPAKGLTIAKNGVGGQYHEPNCNRQMQYRENVNHARNAYTLITLKW